MTKKKKKKKNKGQKKKIFASLEFVEMKQRGNRRKLKLGFIKFLICAFLLRDNAKPVNYKFLTFLRLVVLVFGFR